VTDTARIDRSLVWRVGFAADSYTRDAVSVDRYPFSYRLEVLLRGHDLFRDREGTTWRAAAAERGDPSPAGLVKPASLDGETTVSLDDGLVARLNEAVQVEYPDREVGALSVGERLWLLVSAWNDYNAPAGRGWA
jgi:hypothetical protein